MRLHIEDDDPNVHSPTLEIWLDGKKVEGGCIMADEENGEIEVYIQKSDLPFGADTWPTKILKGEVEIKGYREGWNNAQDSEKVEG